MPQTILYSTSVSPSIQDVSEQEFAEKVGAVLQDPRGWSKYGYKFVRADSAIAKPMLIRLETLSVAEELCKFKGFSCWRPLSNDIIIHHGNWNGGSKSQLPLDRYRNYVINHEVGHSLGLFHQKCPAKECALRGVDPCPASVMQQMTRGPEHIAPCAESDWPLDSSWKIDDPRPARPKSMFIVIAIIIALVVWVILFVTLLLPKTSKPAKTIG